ncbi:MAG: ATP-binding protein [Myxococcales bacterium]|nr:ATP-binding protein [Myxococcales bacterium]
MAAVSASVAHAFLDDAAGVARRWIEALLHRSARGPEALEGVPRSRWAVSAADAVRLLTAAGRPAGDALAADADAAWARLRAARDPDLPFVVLVAALDLDDAAARVVALLAALEHDADLERACAFVWDDFTRKRPDAGFVVDALAGADPEARARVRAALAPDAPLRRYGIIQVGATTDVEAASPARRAVRLTDRAVSHLLGDDSFDVTIEAVAQVMGPAAVADLVLPADTVAMTGRALARGARPRLLLHGPAGTGKLLLVRALAAAAGRPVLRVDVGELLRAPERLDDRLTRIAREAALRRAITVLRAGATADDTAPPADAARLVELVNRLRGPVVLTCHTRPAWLVHAVPDLVEVGVAAPPIRARVALWEQALGDERHLVGADAIGAVAARFALGGEAIHRAAARVRAQAHLRDPSAPRADLPVLTESARLMLQHRLGTVARRVSPGFAWEDLVLPEDTLEVIQEFLGFARHRARLLEEWGFERKLPYGRGVSAILAGPPGTGKTMVAQLVARDLGYDLYVIELSQVVNKYIGETEKNLARVFDEAERSHAVLFFDEADALFAKRTEVKSSNDRYANLEVNYLLQRMESYDGVTLLATNLEHGIDEAFKRRVRFTVQFEMPEPPVRAQLWRSMFPPETPLARDIDWDRLAQRWEMAGGYIKKAAVRAAARAIARGPDAIVTFADLELAATLEYREMGRIG